MAAPYGNNNKTKGRPWADAIRRAVQRYETDDIKRRQALDKIAERLVEDALAGDKDARLELGNRLDGKPHQSMDVSEEVRWVVMLPEPVETSAEWEQQAQKYLSKLDS